MAVEALLARLRQVVGADHVRTDAEAKARYGTDGTKRSHPPAVVVMPGTAAEVAGIVRVCADTRTPIVPRGGGTGYSGGAVPIHGGVVVSLERLDRILEIDQASLLAVVEPNVVTGDLQDAVERVGLFYPPDPASLRQSMIGGNVAENAGGPRAFKYGVTRRYVLGTEAVLPTGEVIQTGGRTVKDVVGYDLTQLLVGSEGTLAILTKLILRLVPKPPAVQTVRACFPTTDAALDAVMRLIAARVVPAAIEIVDAASLEAVATLTGTRLAPAGTGALLLVEVDGLPAQVEAEAAAVEHACRAASATEVLLARDEAERQDLWRVRRELSPALRTIAPVKVNNDVVVPKGRIAELFALVDALRARHGLQIACFGHVGDGNIHVNIMVADESGAIATARAAEQELFRGVVGLGGSISGEHGVGFVKAPHVGLQLSDDVIALMRRLKAAFDPLGILNPGKFPQ